MTTPSPPAWLARNPRADRTQKFGDAQRFVIDPDGIAELCEELKACPAHKPTPLHALPALAARLGLGALRVKDESQRFGFGAFKALGGVLAVSNVLAEAVGAARAVGAVGEARHATPGFESLMKGEHRDITAGFVFTTASSGNHGRSVAAGAKLFGNRCDVQWNTASQAELDLPRLKFDSNKCRFCTSNRQANIHQSFGIRRHSAGLDHVFAVGIDPGKTSFRFDLSS